MRSLLNGMDVLLGRVLCVLVVVDEVNWNEAAGTKKKRPHFDCKLIKVLRLKIAVQVH